MESLVKGKNANLIGVEMKTGKFESRTQHWGPQLLR
jgi:hypothetical protein